MMMSWIFLKIISVIYERMTNYADTFVELRNNKINFKRNVFVIFGW